MMSEDKTSVVDSDDTLKLRLDEARKTPPALVLLMGPTGLVGKQWPLDRREMLVGRAPECDIQIDEKSMSKRHARIIINEEAVNVVDNGSLNGTEVESMKLAPNTPCTLSDNARIKLGNVILKFLARGNIETVAAATTYDRGNIDGLTQILNKTATMSQLNESFKKAQLTETNLSLIVFDLDNFKRVNDSPGLGHPAGDYVLREVASVVKNQLIRSGDAFGRYGGEEFVVILYGSPLPRACDVAERIRSTIEKHNFTFSGRQLQVTVSLGVAALDSSISTPEALFAKADQALYVSKGSGKNRVSTV